jgi:hypothetical protein
MWSFHCLNYWIDTPKDPSNKTILYIPWVSFSIKETQSLSDTFVDSWYNFIRFSFPYNNKNVDVWKFNIKDDLSVIKEVLLDVQKRWIKINSLWIIAKSFGSIKVPLLKNIKIQCYWFISPVIYFSRKPTINLVKTSFYNDIKSFDEILFNDNILKKWSVPVILMHWLEDNVVSYSNSEFIYKNLKIWTPKEIYWIKWLAHSIKKEETKDFINKKLLMFFRKYL